MKNLLLLLSFFIATTQSAQTTDISTAIGENLSQISANTNQIEWQTLSQSFDKIASQNSEEWLANYYAAYSYMKLAGTYKDQTLPIVAEHLDKAQAIIDKAIKLAPENAEVIVLQGFIYIARIWESPFMNGGLYGRKISKLFKQAIEIDPENSRAYYLKGLLTFHTPRFVGGGKEKAKPWLVTATKKFEAFNFESDTMPYWGAEENALLLGECGGMAAKLNR